MTDLATKMRKKRRKQPLPKGRLTAGGPNFGRNKYGDPGFRFFSLKSKLYPYPLFIKFRWMNCENFSKKPLTNRPHSGIITLSILGKAKTHIIKRLKVCLRVAFYTHLD